MTESVTAAPGRIFISYRREETGYPAGWLYHRLVDQFGAGQVFKDVDSIKLGDDFVDVISTAVESCDVLLALIGDAWLTIADEEGNRRIDDPADFVRLEIEAALSRRVRVIPILVDGAKLPSEGALPASLAGLVRRQALELSPERFDSDVSHLVRVVEETLAELRQASAPIPTPAPASAPTPPPAPAAVPAPAPTPTQPAMGASDVSAPNTGERPPRRTVSIGRRWILAGIGVAVALTVMVLALVITSRGTEPSGGGIDVGSVAETGPDGLRLTGLTATSRHDPDPPLVGDTVTVSYELTNVTDEPVQLEFTFVGVRDPSDTNRDTEDVNEGTVIQPNESV
ncbi:MAG TPA: toll/interleukin-1 receptor domain-containing protein, partial [Pedococcus sp.]|nr:toll/interleukin-1 receptor domain-containing protein [Pedococcus sp.]